MCSSNLTGVAMAVAMAVVAQHSEHREQEANAVESEIAEVCGT